MYKCDRCSSYSLPNEKLNRLVVEVRPTVYFKIAKSEDGIVSKQPAGQGFETVREVCVCSTCLSKERKLAS